MLAIASNAAAGTRTDRPTRTAGSPSRPPVSKNRRVNAYADVRLIRRTRAASSTRRNGPCSPTVLMTTSRQMFQPTYQRTATRPIGTKFLGTARMTTLLDPLSAPLGPSNATLRWSPDTFTAVSEVKDRRRGATRISSKHQITIPAEALRGAGLEVGDRVVAHVVGPGRLVLEREADVVAEFAGALTGTYHPDELGQLRAEWD